VRYLAASQTPSQGRLGNPGLIGSRLDRRPIVAPVVGISPKEFPREFGRLEFVYVVVRRTIHARYFAITSSRELLRPIT
jgi:hypothetical protein